MASVRSIRSSRHMVMMAFLCSAIALVSSSAALAANSPPSLGSGPIVTPSTTVYAGQSCTIITYAFDADGNSLQYAYEFGDGVVSQASALSFAFHAYSSPGTYSLKVSVFDGTVTVSSTTTVTVVSTLVGTGLDTDGDGFSDAFEDEVGSNKNSLSSTPLGSSAANPARILPFGITKSAISLDFVNANKDSIKLSGDLYDFGVTTANGKGVTVDVGGIVRKFTLDEKGNGSLNSKADSLKINGRFGVNNIGVKNGTFKVAITLSKASFLSQLANFGLTNLTNTNKSVTIPMTIIFDGSVFQQKGLALKYTSVLGKGGKAK